MAVKQAPSKPEPTHAPSPLGHNVLTALAVIGILILIWLIVVLKPVVVLVLISVVLATGLAPMVARLERIRLRGRPLPRAVAILITYIIAFLIFVGAATIIVVPTVQQSVKFARHMPEYTATAKAWLADMHHKHSSIPDYAGLLDKARSQLDEAAGYALTSVGAAFGVFGGIISVITVLVITSYLLSNYELMRRKFLSLMPPQHEGKISATMSKMAAVMGAWLRGQLILAGIVGVVSFLGMLVLGVPYASVIAIVGAIGELVPMLGPFAAAVPAVLVAAFGPLWKVIAVVAFFAVLAQVEGNFLSPRVMERQVGLNPLITILALLAGATLFGLVGALLAIPFAAAGQVLFVEMIAPAIRKSAGRRDREQK